MDVRSLYEEVLNGLTSSERADVEDTVLRAEREELDLSASFESVAARHKQARAAAMHYRCPHGRRAM